MAAHDFYAKSTPTKLGGLLTERGQRGIVAALQKKNKIHKLLETGTGKGKVARACRDLGIDYVGTDCSAAIAEQAQADGFRVAYACVPPLPDLMGFKPDVALSIYTLSNLPSYEHAQGFVASAGSRRDPEGLLLLTAPELSFARWSFLAPGLTGWLRSARLRDTKRCQTSIVYCVCSDVKSSNKIADESGCMPRAMMRPERCYLDNGLS